MVNCKQVNAGCGDQNLHLFSFLINLFQNSFSENIKKDYITSELYSEPNQTSMMELFCENYRLQIIFAEKLHHRRVTGF